MSTSNKALIVLLSVGVLSFACKQVDGDKDKSNDGADLPGVTGGDTLPGGNAAAGCFGFTEDVEPLLQQHCVSCHAVGGESAQVDLTTFANASQHAERAVARAVTQGDMPPPARGLPPFPEDAKLILQTWASGGKFQSKTECPTTQTTGSGTDGSTTGTTTGTTTGGTGDPGTGFGTAEDVAFASELWLAMRRGNLVGPGSAKGLPVQGSEPHGAVVAISWGEVTVDGRKDNVYIKHNYGPAGVTPADVLTDPEKEPAAITVIFQRESTFDSSINNKFFVQYLADGSIDENDDSTPLAGRVGKGGDTGCVPCHSNAEGGDYLYWND